MDKKIEKELQELHTKLKAIDYFELIEQLDNDSRIMVVRGGRKKYVIYVNYNRICESDNLIIGLVSAYKILNYVEPKQEQKNVIDAKESASEVLISAVGMVREQPETLTLTELIDRAVKDAYFIEAQEYYEIDEKTVRIRDEDYWHKLKISRVAMEQLLDLKNKTHFTAHVTPNDVIYFIQSNKK